MNILRKEEIWNRWLVWVEYTPEEAAFLEFEGLDEPSETQISDRFNEWVTNREQNGATQ